MILWISSYPKSGNTWVRTFLSTYYFSKNNEFNFNLLKNIKQFPHEKFFNQKINNIQSAIDNWDKAQTKINSINKFIFLKTHSALVKINNTPFTSKKHTAGGIYIVRDPRNVITSMSNHYQLDFDETLKFMTDEKKFLIDNNKYNNFANFTFLNSWSNHYKSWMENKQFDTLFIKYEDLEKNTKDTFFLILKFINNTKGINDKIDIDRMCKIISSIDFKKLQTKEEKEGFPESIAANNNKIKFFYLGKRNKWKNILSANQINLVNRIFRKDLEKLGYER